MPSHRPATHSSAAPIVHAVNRSVRFPQSFLVSCFTILIQAAAICIGISARPFRRTISPVFVHELPLSIGRKTVETDNNLSAIYSSTDIGPIYLPSTNVWLSARRSTRWLQTARRQRQQPAILSFPIHKHPRRMGIDLPVFRSMATSSVQQGAVNFVPLRVDKAPHNHTGSTKLHVVVTQIIHCRSILP